MTPFKLTLLCLVMGNLSACYPAYRTHQPEINLQITDVKQLPIAGVKVVLNTRAHASGVNEFVVKNSDSNGQVLFNSNKQVDVELVFMHGSLQYFWDICIEKQDYLTENIRIDEPADAVKLNKIALKAGESAACLHK